MAWWLVGFHGWGRHEELAETSAQQGRQVGCRWVLSGHHCMSLCSAQQGPDVKLELQSDIQGDKQYKAQAGRF